MSKRGKNTIRASQRYIRVFISSTFRDMHEEREELVKRVFPQLRKLCEQRSVIWGEVDLRWGVTDEQMKEGKTLPICLAEIQRCRPYFIGLLGERYGWVPDEIPQELINQEPWLKEHLDLSVTELEILHGVLNNPEMAEHSFFYFRDPEFTNRLPKGVNISEYISEDESSRAKLFALKERIRKSGFPVRENYPDPQTLGQLVLKDMTRLINQLYPKSAPLDRLDSDVADHEAFAQSRARVYIGGEEYFNLLNEHVKDNGPPLVVIGESGSGKSALLANWVMRFREQNKNINEAELIIMHFIGASPYSTDWMAMLRRIMGELKRRFDIRLDIPDKPEELQQAFANWIHMASAKGRIILILDALNMLEDRDGAPDLVWLPPVIPPNIRMILSSLPGRPLDELKKRGWPTLAVEPLRTEERRIFIDTYLAQYTKSLSPSQAQMIASAKPTANPLFLQALLEELRVFGVHEQLGKHIENYLEARTIPELYEKILARYEEDYERDRPGLVGEALSLLWAARKGMSEAEILELLGTIGQPLPRLYWSPFYLATEQALVRRSNLLGFFHDYLRQAVQYRYLKTEEKQQAAHLRLADYFQARDLNMRKVDELPWQLSQANSWHRLYELLAEKQFFTAAWDINKFELESYWSQVETNSALRLADAYKGILEFSADYKDFIWKVAILLHETGHLNEALQLRNFLVNYYRQIGDKKKLADALRNLALILTDQGNLDKAMAMLKEDEHLCRISGHKTGLSNSLNSQANILMDQGDLDQAMALHKEQERLSQELGNKWGLWASIANQARILRCQGQLDMAMALHKKEEHLCRELGNKRGLSISYGNQGLILFYKGDWDNAMSLFNQQEALCHELGDKYWLSVCLGNKAMILYSRRDLDGAMALHKDEECLCRELGDKEGLSICLGNQALILKDRGDLDSALILHKEEERLYHELGRKEGIQRSLGNQAMIIYACNELHRAMDLLKRQAFICQELGLKIDLSICLGNQALIQRDLGNADEAMKLHNEEERLCQELGYKEGLQRSLGNQALILQSHGNLDDALALLKEQERICRKLKYPEGLATSLINQAKLLLRKNKNKEALCLAEESYNLAKSNGLTQLAKQIKPMLKKCVKG